jgi:hypothetical protein
MNIKLLKRLRDKKELKLFNVLAEQYKKDDRVCFYDLALLIVDGYITTDFYYQDLITAGQKLQKLDAVPLCKILYGDYKSNKEGDVFAANSTASRNLYYTNKAGEYLKEHSTKVLNRWYVGMIVVATVVAILSFLYK